MPIRKTPFVNENIYHVFNRGVNRQPIFLTKRDYARAVELLKYYSAENPPLRYSKFLIQPNKERERMLSELQTQQKRADIICFCLMPNHFHLLLKQNQENGLTSFVRNFQISYTRYFNVKRKRIGPLLQGQFKAVRIETDDQLLHVSRYIHLNPYSSYIVKHIEQLDVYPWSSYMEYTGVIETQICQKDLVFSNIKDTKEYKKFVSDQADYQRKIEQIKHLIIESN